MKNLSIILFLGLILTSFSCKTQPEKTANEQEKTPAVTVISEVLSTDMFQAKINELGGFQLIDVRTPEEFQEGTIKGSQNINVLENSFADLAQKLDKNKPVMVYCRRGGRSGRAAKTLKELGFTEIYDLDGGITAWKGDNMPVERPSN